MQTRTAEGRAVRLLTLMDEYTRECLAIRVERKLSSEEVDLVPSGDVLTICGVNN